MPRDGKEKNFVERLISYIKNKNSHESIEVNSAWKVPYLSVRHAYNGKTPLISDEKTYETDILISEWIDDDHWRPSVIIECKYNNVTTHDLITYSRKAEAHRTLHPYLRYGLVVGGFQQKFPGRMIAHGTEFDFMATIPPNKEDQSFSKIVDVVNQEIEFSRLIWTASQRSSLDEGVTIIHRPLRII